MANILFTGGMANMTDRNYSKTRSRLRLATTTDALIAALEEQGHTVTAKVVVPGEDLSMYDQLIVGLTGLFSNLCSYTCGVYWALSKFPDALLTVNDWRVLDAMKMVDPAFKKSESYFTSFIPGNNEGISKLNKVDDYNALLLKHWDVIMEAKAKFDCAQGNTLIFPAYKGFNREKLKVANPVVRYNPGAYMIQDEFTSDASEKQNVHIIAGAAKPNWSWYKKMHPQWTDLESAQAASAWDIKTYGGWCKNTLPESELTHVIAQSKGIIVPSYNQIAGVGMWRPRHVIAKNVQRLIICDKDEGLVMGEGYGQHTIAEIESMTDSQYKELVDLQAKSFNDAYETRAEVQEQLKSII